MILPYELYASSSYHYNNGVFLFSNGCGEKLDKIGDYTNLINECHGIVHDSIANNLITVELGYSLIKDFDEYRSFPQIPNKSPRGVFYKDEREAIQPWIENIERKRSILLRLLESSKARKEKENEESTQSSINMASLCVKVTSGITKRLDIISNKMEEIQDQFLISQEIHIFKSKNIDIDKLEDIQ
jgi:hypothetical protein